MKKNQNNSELTRNEQIWNYLQLEIDAEFNRYDKDKAKFYGEQLEVLLREELKK